MQNQEKFTNIVVEHERQTLEVFGPRLHFLVRPEANDEAPCVIKGTVPAGVSVPMHSHAGIEAFYVLGGEIEVLSEKPINQGENVEAPLPQEIQHFIRTAERYGYWLATPEENALIGISLFQTK